eukprot:GEMP01002171.1.p1 GENE.GEMP01002171.1~~GEMP01002171.1.p1  ORF type:complete len:1319 (+),score=254.94 GEMP01002171.1:115-4071(+)
MLTVPVDLRDRRRLSVETNNSFGGFHPPVSYMGAENISMRSSTSDAGRLGSPRFRSQAHAMPVPPASRGSVHTGDNIHQMLYQSNAQLQQTREQVTQLQEQLNGVRQWMSTIDQRHLVRGSSTTDPPQRTPDYRIQQSHSANYQQSQQRVWDSQQSWPRITDSQQSLARVANYQQRSPQQIAPGIVNYQTPQSRPSNSQPSQSPAEYQQSRSRTQNYVHRALGTVPSPIIEEEAEEELGSTIEDIPSRRQQIETWDKQIDATDTKRQLRERTPAEERFVRGNAKQSQSSTVAPAQSVAGARAQSPASRLAKSPFRERAQSRFVKQAESTIANRTGSPTANRQLKPRPQTSDAPASPRLQNYAPSPSKQRRLKFDPLPRGKVDPSYSRSTAQQPSPQVDPGLDILPEETLAQDRRRSPAAPRLPPSSYRPDPEPTGDSTPSSAEPTAARHGRLVRAPSEPQRRMSSLLEYPMDTMVDPAINSHSFAPPTFQIPALRTKPNISAMEAAMRNRPALQAFPVAAPAALRTSVASGGSSRNIRPRSVEVPNAKTVALYAAKGIRAISPIGTRNTSPRVRQDGMASPVCAPVAQPQVATVPTQPSSPSARAQKSSSPSRPAPADIGSSESSTPRSDRNGQKADALTRSALKKLVDTNDNINRLIHVLDRAVSIWQPAGHAEEIQTRYSDDAVHVEVGVNFSCDTTATTSSELSEARAAKPGCSSSAKGRYTRSEHKTPLEPNDFTQSIAKARRNRSSAGESSTPTRRTPQRSRPVSGKMPPDREDKTRSAETIVPQRRAPSGTLNTKCVALNGDELAEVQVKHAVVETPLVKAREGAHSVPRLPSPVQPFARQLSPRQPFGRQLAPEMPFPKRGYMRKPPVPPPLIPKAKSITAGAPWSKNTRHAVRSQSPHARTTGRYVRDMPETYGTVSKCVDMLTRTSGASGSGAACRAKGATTGKAQPKTVMARPRMNEDSTLSGFANTSPRLPGPQSTEPRYADGEVYISVSTSPTNRAAEPVSPPYAGRGVDISVRTSPLIVTPRSQCSGNSWMPMSPLSDCTESIPLLMRTTIQFHKPTCIRCFEAKVYACDERCLVLMDRNTKRIFAANISAKYVAVLVPTDVAYVTDVEGQLWSNEKDHAHFRRVALPDNCFASGVVYREKLFVADAMSNCVWALNPSAGMCLLVISSLNNPQGLNWFGEYLLIADTGHGRIVKVRKPLQRLPDDEVIIAAGGGDGSDDRQVLNAPMDMAINPAGCMFIADAGNQCIMVWPSNASAGKPLKNYAEIHPNFVQPRSVCISHHWLLVADHGYSDILQIKLNSKARKR